MLQKQALECEWLHVSICLSMAKELPYFKFEPNAWDNGNIQLCSRESKGLFIDICSTYWSRLGELPYALALQKHCNGNASALHELLERQIFSIENENIIIEFLDEQLNEFQQVSVKRSKAANKRWENANAMQMQCTNDANAMLLREEEKREEKKKVDKKRVDEVEKKSSEKIKIDLKPFPESFRTEWEKWIFYKKTEHKQTYKRIETQQTAFKHLLELSEGDPSTASKIIQQSVANQYKGLFKLKDDSNQKQQSPLGTHRIGKDWSKPL